MLKIRKCGSEELFWYILCTDSSEFVSINNHLILELESGKRIELVEWKIQVLLS